MPPPMRPTLAVTPSTGAFTTLSTSGNATVGGVLTVTGNLVVNGTTTTVNSTVTTIDDPVVTLGGDTAPVADDGKDRGIEFRWHNGTAGSCQGGWEGDVAMLGMELLRDRGCNLAEGYWLGYPVTAAEFAQLVA